MALLPIIYAPHPIFRQKSVPVERVDDNVRKIVDDMLETLAYEQAVGLGANMVGVLQRIAVVDLCENNVSYPYRLINPEIIWRSEHMQLFEEASLSYPGISAMIKRPQAIRVGYLDYDGKAQLLEAEGYLATVIQHEVDYLDGKVYLDYLSKMRRDGLLKKMEKHMKLHPPHRHTQHCKH